jgi:plastocyanin
LDRFHHAALVAASLAAGALALSACGRDDVNLVKGKEQFVSNCGGCHTLARAGTKGVQGPNLDDAFASARRDGMTAKTVQGVVRHQIAYPIRDSGMPAKLVKGDTANDVAGYVGFAAGIPGKDTGPLGEAGQPKTSGKPVAAQKGTLTIDAVDGTAFSATKATAPAGQLTVKMPNKSPLQHDIVLQGVPGAHGKLVSQGGTSTFSVSLKPGKYTYFCSVPGHEAAGMKGALTVK